jgi:hypothetical protein
MNHTLPRSGLGELRVGTAGSDLRPDLSTRAAEVEKAGASRFRRTASWACARYTLFRHPRSRHVSVIFLRALFSLAGTVFIGQLFDSESATGQIPKCTENEDAQQLGLDMTGHVSESE